MATKDLKVVEEGQFRRSTMGSKHGKGRGWNGGVWEETEGTKKCRSLNRPMSRPGGGKKMKAKG